MSPQNCSLAYADEVENEAHLFHNSLDAHGQTLKLMGRSITEIHTIDEIVEFGGTITVSF